MAATRPIRPASLRAGQRYCLSGRLYRVLAPLGVMRPARGAPVHVFRSLREDGRECRHEIPASANVYRA